VIAPCAVHIPLHRIPAHVAVIRHGRRLSAAHRRGTRRARLFLQGGDDIRVGRTGHFVFTYTGNRYRLGHGEVRLDCRRLLLDPGRRPSSFRVLAVRLDSGRVEVRSGPRARHALVLTSEMLAMATSRATLFSVQRNPSTRRTAGWTLNQPIVAAKASDQTLRINSRLTYTAYSDRGGLRLDIWPFSISPLQRPTRPSDGLVPFWADGRPCSVGCTAPGAIPGWPIQPFHSQHAIRAGINELRPANFHVAVDVEARDFTSVYAIQSGFVHIRYMGTGDVNVDVGSFDYWHIHPTVSEGAYAAAYRTKIGWVLTGFKHVAVSEGHGVYLNPLRPGGSLRPYGDTEPPIIGVPQIFADGRAVVRAFDPQSFVERMSFETPVLAPSSLAWRLYDARGHALTGLEWAMRGSQNYSPGLRTTIFAPGASNPGFVCFAFRVRCIPNWAYWLAGGLAPRLPLGSLGSGRYRLTVYAWDWAGNTSALDYWFGVPLAHAAQAPTGPLLARY
jgi:hypothetical protein